MSCLLQIQVLVNHRLKTAICSKTKTLKHFEKNGNEMNMTKKGKQPSEKKRDGKLK